MPLWSSINRSLLLRCPRQLVFRYTGHWKPWQPARLQLQSSSIALQDDLRDDKGEEPIDLEAGSPAKLQNDESALDAGAGEVEPLRSHESTSLYKPPASSADSNPITSRGRSSSFRGANSVLRTSKRRTVRRSAAILYPPRWRGRGRYSITPAKLVPLQSTKNPSAIFSTLWNRQFAKLAIRYDPKLQQHRVEPMVYTEHPLLHPQAHEWAASAIDRLDQGDQFLSLQDLPVQKDKHPLLVWKHVALWLLAYDPKQMLRFLPATHQVPYPQPIFIADSLLHLSRYLTRPEEPEKAEHMQRLANMFHILAHREDGEILSIINPFIRTMVAHCTDDEIYCIYRTIKVHRVSVHPYTYLHFVTRFANHNRFHQAFEALIDAKNAGARMNHYSVRSNCANLLRRSVKQPDGLRASLRIATAMVEMGVKLNNQLCDIIMLNAVEAGHLNVAFDVYHSLTHRGLRPTESTFAILLKGCKSNIKDGSMLNQVIRDAIGNINVRESPLVATEILHCLSLHHLRKNPETALTTLTEAYNQLFDLTPLLCLKLPIPESSKQLPTSKITPNLMQPTRHAMTFMIGVSLEHLDRHGADAGAILRIYELWRAAVEAGSPSALADLATTDHIFNIFLMGFIRTPYGLVHAARVMRDMQRSLPPEAGVEQCKPTVQTWSIFLHGFMRHGQTELGEQILNYMRSKGVEPNEVTWRTVINGYVRAEDEESALDALRRAKAGGVSFRTWEYLSRKRLKNLKGKLMEVLEEEIKAGDGESPRERDGFVDLSADIEQQQHVLREGVETAPQDPALQHYMQRFGGDDFLEGSGQTSGSASQETGGFADSPAELAEQHPAPGEEKEKESHQDQDPALEHYKRRFDI